MYNIKLKKWIQKSLQRANNVEKLVGTINLTLRMR